MTFKSICLSVLVLVVSGVCTSKAAPEGTGSELARVTAVVERAMHAIYISGDEAEMMATLHRDYAIISMRGDRLARYPAAQLIADTQKRKAEGKFPTFPNASYVIDSVEVAETTAVAKVRFFQDGVHTCSDFILLYRFPEGWKFVALTTHHHAELKRS